MSLPVNYQTLEQTFAAVTPEAKEKLNQHDEAVRTAKISAKLLTLNLIFMGTIAVAHILNREDVVKGVAIAGVGTNCLWNLGSTAINAMRMQSLREWLTNARNVQVISPPEV